MEAVENLGRDLPGVMTFTPTKRASVLVLWDQKLDWVLGQER